MLFKIGQLNAEGNAGKHTVRHIVRTGSCRESIAIGLNFPTNLCKRKSLNLRNHTKTMNNDESYITLILLDRNELEIIIMEGIREWLPLSLEMCWQFLTYILDQRKYVEFVPFGRFLRVKRHHFLHTWKIQVYILYNIYIYLYIMYIYI